MNTVCEFNNLTRSEWLVARQQGIGSSEIASVLGIGFESPAELYARKIAATVEERPPTERMELGNVLEPYIAERYTRATGIAIDKAPQLAYVVDRPWQMASGEYMAADRLVECKAVFSPPSYPWGDPLTDRIPDYYLLQVTQQAGVFGEQLVDVAALFVGSEFRRYVVPFNPELFQIITEAGEDFWSRVVARLPIERTWQSVYGRIVAQKLLKLREDLEITLGAEAEYIAAHYLQHTEMKSRAEREQKKARDQLLAMMGEASRATLPSGTVITHKIIKRRRISAEATEYPRLFFKKPNQPEEVDES